MDKARDARRFSELLTSLEKYFGRELDARLKLVYFTGLADLGIEQVERAVQLAIVRLRWFPKIAELREFIEGDSSDRAGAAWQLFEQALGTVGYYKGLWCEDGALAEAIRRTFGGWPQACTAQHPVYAAYDRDGEDTLTGRQVGGLSPEMTAARRKEFIAHYRAAEREGRGFERYLVGGAEANNRNSSRARGAMPATQPFGVIAGGAVRSVSLPVDQDGRLLDSVRRQLEAGQFEGLDAARLPLRLAAVAAPGESSPLMTVEDAIATRDAALAGLNLLRDGLPARLRTMRQAAPSASPETVLERHRLLQPAKEETNDEQVPAAEMPELPGAMHDPAARRQPGM